MKNFAQIITEKRKELGITQEALATKLGITPQAVSKWENGVGLPDVTLFPAIACALDVSTDELFGINRAEPAETPCEFPQKHEGLPFVGEVNGTACYSDKTFDRIEENLFYFTDGSVADLAKGEVRNCGKGEIRLIKSEQVCRNTKVTIETEGTDLEAFSSLNISLSKPCELKLLRGKHYRIEVMGDADFMKALQTKVENNTLTLSVPSTDQYNHKTKVKNSIVLYMPFTRGKTLVCTLHGSSDVQIEPDFEKMTLFINGSGNILGKNADSLQAKVNGSGDITLDTTKTAVLLVNGSGDIAIKAITENADATINGSGDIELGETKNTTLRIVGSGDIVIGRATGDLNTNISGSGDIEVDGEVENFTCTIAGSGDIHAANLTATTAEITTKGDSSATITIGHIKGVSTEKIGKNTTLVVKKRG